MPGAGAKHAIRMEAQGALADIVRQNAEIDAADLGEIARCQRAGDRLGAVPPFQRALRALRIILRGRSRNDRAVPVLDHIQRVGVFQALDLHQPVDVITTGAAAEAIEVIPVDPHAGLRLAVQRAQDHAAGRHLTVDQVGEINLRLVERRRGWRGGVLPARQRKLPGRGVAPTE